MHTLSVAYVSKYIWGVCSYNIFVYGYIMFNSNFSFSYLTIIPVTMGFCCCNTTNCLYVVATAGFPFVQCPRF